MSPHDLLKRSATNVEMDALNIRYDSQLKSFSAQGQADLDRQQAGDASTAGSFNAGAAALTAGGNCCQASYRYGRGWNGS